MLTGDAIDAEARALVEQWLGPIVDLCSAVNGRPLSVLRDLVAESLRARDTRVTALEAELAQRSTFCQVVQRHRQGEAAAFKELETAAMHVVGEVMQWREFPSIRPLADALAHLARVRRDK